MEIASGTVVPLRFGKLRALVAAGNDRSFKEVSRAGEADDHAPASPQARA